MAHDCAGRTVCPAQCMLLNTSAWTVTGSSGGQRFGRSREVLGAALWRSRSASGRVEIVLRPNALVLAAQATHDHYAARVHVGGRQLSQTAARGRNRLREATGEFLLAPPNTHPRPIRLISLEISRPGPIRGGLMICGSRCLPHVPPDRTSPTAPVALPPDRSHGGAPACHGDILRSGAFQS